MASKFDKLYEAVMGESAGKRAFPLENDPNTLRIEFPYRPNTVDDVKKLAGRRYMDRYWIAPATPENIAKLKSFGFEVEGHMSDPPAAKDVEPAKAEPQTDPVVDASGKAFTKNTEPDKKVATTTIKVETPYGSRSMQMFKIKCDPAIESTIKRIEGRRKSGNYWLVPANDEDNARIIEKLGFIVELSPVEQLRKDIKNMHVVEILENEDFTCRVLDGFMAGVEKRLRAQSFKLRLNVDGVGRMSQGTEKDLISFGADVNDYAFLDDDTLIGLRDGATYKITNGKTRGKTWLKLSPRYDGLVAKSNKALDDKLTKARDADMRSSDIQKMSHVLTPIQNELESLLQTKVMPTMEWLEPGEKQYRVTSRRGRTSEKDTTVQWGVSELSPPPKGNGGNFHIIKQGVSDVLGNYRVSSCETDSAG